MVQEVRIDARAGSSDLSRIVQAIRGFARRETSLNPIYRYEMVEVATSDRGTVRALICRADDSHGLFLGRDRMPRSRSLTLWEKAAIVATSRGVPKASLRETGLEYARFVGHGWHGEGIAHAAFKEVLETANTFRALLLAKERLRMKIIEQRGVLTGAKPRLDRSVFRCNVRLGGLWNGSKRRSGDRADRRRNPRFGGLTANDVERLRASACRKLGLLEPLRREKLARTEAVFRELHR